MTDQPQPPGLFSKMKTGAASTDYRARPLKLTREELRRIGIPDPHHRARFKRVPEPAREPLRRYMGEGVDPRLKERLNTGQGLWIFGEPGTGKTAIASIIARRARAWRYTVHFATATSIRDARRNHLMYDPDIELTVWDRCHAVDLLVIDDLREADLADKYYGEAEFYSLMRMRSDAGKTTIVTTEMGISHPFAAKVQNGVAGMGPFRVRGENRTRERNKALYYDLFSDD